jgi:hypothetical protein
MGQRGLERVLRAVALRQCQGRNRLNKMIRIINRATEWNGARNKDREEDDTERPMKIVLTIMPLCS